MGKRYNLQPVFTRYQLGLRVPDGTCLISYRIIVEGPMFKLNGITVSASAGFPRNFPGNHFPDILTTRFTSLSTEKCNDGIVLILVILPSTLTVNCMIIFPLISRSLTSIGDAENF